MGSKAAGSEGGKEPTWGECEFSGGVEEEGGITQKDKDEVDLSWLSTCLLACLLVCLAAWLRGCVAASCLRACLLCSLAFCYRYRGAL